ncbi:hypothetical protein PIB30_063775 [Stylosanthes scabra]|uniref:Retrotransposon gag domain-containing protein n=1 Tax=Stylosanthes scabra TaxID=79078 RepID=A0ABU6YJ13_9FABA|nr:hypothetical protein [Stylosanthes scabra]
MHSSSKKDDIDLARKTTCRYKKKGWDESPPVDGHMPFPNQILRVQLPRHFVKLDMEYDGSTDPHEHLRGFEYQMVCDRAIDKVKCRAFPITLTGLASKWFMLSTRSISTFVESTRKYVEQFNEKYKTIDGLTNSVASLCLTNGLTNDDFRKQLTTKLMWSRKEIQVIAKEFMYHEEGSQNSEEESKSKSRKRGLQIRPSRCRRTHGFKDGDLKTHRPSVMELGDHFIKPDGSIELPITIGKGNARKMTTADMRQTWELSRIVRQPKSAVTATEPHGRSLEKQRKSSLLTWTP